MRVYAIIPQRFGGFKLNGVVNRVHRDVIDKNISISIKDKVYVFREPDLITKIDEHEILFVYGHVTGEDKITDEELLEEMRIVASKGGNIDDALSNLKSETVNIISFKMKELKNGQKSVQFGKKRGHKNSPRVSKSKSKLDTSKAVKTKKSVKLTSSVKSELGKKHKKKKSTKRSTTKSGNSKSTCKNAKRTNETGKKKGQTK